MTDMCWVHQTKVADNPWQPPLPSFWTWRHYTWRYCWPHPARYSWRFSSLGNHGRRRRSYGKNNRKTHWMWHSVQGVHRKPLITKRRKAELTEAKPSKKTLFLWDPKAATQEALQTWLLLWGLSRFGRAGMVGCGNHINIDYILRWPTSVGRAKNIAHLCLSNKSILNPGKCTQVFWDLLTFFPKKGALGN